MIPRLRIGNQTAIACAERMEPFEFALRHGFGAFEWFADKKEYPGGSAAGWDESDMDQGLRAWIRDIGADLVNLHLNMAEGAPGFVRSLEPVVRYAAESGLRLSIENTPRTTPADFNQTFASLRELDAVGPGTVGMCLDLGHANLCTPTHNDFIR